jgi:hypothetical protein
MPKKKSEPLSACSSTFNTKSSPFKSDRNKALELFKDINWMDGFIFNKVYLIEVTV